VHSPGVGLPLPQVRYREIVHSPGVGPPLLQVGYRDMCTHQEWEYLFFR
jgi:hypothetical protein